MAIKKSELYGSLWKSCDELRGGMDASQYKDYVLVLLFMKYVSDKYAGDPRALIEVPKGGSFADMVALKGDKEIGDKINKIIAKLAMANDLKGVIDVADFNDADKLGGGKEMVDRLSNLVAIFNRPELDFRQKRPDAERVADSCILRPSRARVSPNGSFLKVARDARCPILPSKSRGRSSRRESSRGRRECRTRPGPLPDGGGASGGGW